MLNTPDTTETPVTLDHAAIAALIPHQGKMCLLDGVTAWSAQGIQCSSTTHLDADNPLRTEGRLGIACGIEYAAQAMAVHGSLLANLVTVGPRPERGYLVSVRNVIFSTDTLDSHSAALQIEAERLSGDDSTVLYQFQLSCADQPLLSGRATVVLDSTKS